MRLNRKTLYFIQALTLALSMPALAEEADVTGDVTIVPVGNQSQELRTQFQVPEHNQTMDQVLEIQGDPNQVFSVGSPKITRWTYNNMTVYFEKDKVLRTVLHTPERQSTQVATQQ